MLISGRDVIISIKVQEGLQGSSIHKEHSELQGTEIQEEVLFKRGTVYRITSMQSLKTARYILKRRWWNT